MQLFCTGQQILRWNKTFVFLVNILENPFNVLGCVVLIRLLGHQFYKLLEIDLTSIVSIKNWHSDVNESSPWSVSTLSDVLPQIQRCQHAIMIIIQEIEYLFINLYISYRTLSNKELFRIKIDILPNSRKTVSPSTLRLCTLLHTIIISKILSMSPA